MKLSSAFVNDIKDSLLDNDLGSPQQQDAPAPALVVSSGGVAAGDDESLDFQQISDDDDGDFATNIKVIDAVSDYIEENEPMDQGWAEMKAPQCSWTKMKCANIC